MYLNKITSSILVVAIATIACASNALAQQCSDPSAISTTSILSNATNLCCPKKVRKQRVCLGNQIQKMKNTRGTLTSLKDLRASSCEAGAPACDDSTALVRSEVTDNMSAQCCSKTQTSARIRCLKNQRKKLINARSALGSTANSDIKEIFRELRDSDSCGAGGESGGSGEPSGQCQSFRSFPTGWLWKPDSDVSDARGGKGVFVVNRSKPGGRTAVIVDKNGNQVCTAGFKAPNEAGINCNSDHYYVGGFGCGKTGGQIESAAKSSSGSVETYLRFGSTCYGPFIADDRKGGIVC